MTRASATPVEIGVARSFVSDSFGQVSIQSRRMSRATGLTDAEAYGALADLVVRGIRA